MIDTVRVKIRLNGDSSLRLDKICQFTERQFTDKKGNLTTYHYGTFVFPLTKAKLNIFFDQYRHDTFYFEVSLPKIWYGDNVHLLYDEQLEPVLQIIHEVFSRSTGDWFPHYSTWPIQRLDTTYAWKFESEEKAIEVMEYIRRLELPRNSFHYYPPGETVTFGSKKSRTVTFYRKFPEFQKKGLPELLRNGLSEQALDCSRLAEGVVRFEVVNKVEHLKAYFHADRPVLFDSFIGKKVVPDILNMNLNKLRGDIDMKVIHDRALFKALLVRNKANKALRIFCFDKAFNSQLSTRKIIERFANSSDISENLKELKEARAVVPTFLSSSQFDLSIPSSYVVNNPPSSAAIAAELKTHIRSIRNLIEQVVYVPKPHNYGPDS